MSAEKWGGGDVPRSGCPTHLPVGARERACAALLRRIHERLRPLAVPRQDEIPPTRGLARRDAPPAALAAAASTAAPAALASTAARTAWAAPAAPAAPAVAGSALGPGAGLLDVRHRHVG